MDRGMTFGYPDDWDARHYYNTNHSGGGGPGSVITDSSQRGLHWNSSNPHHRHHQHPQQRRYNDLVPRNSAGGSFTASMKDSGRNTSSYVDKQHSREEEKDSNSDSQSQKKLKGIIRRFGEKCSMQGPPYITASTWWLSRLLWTLLFLTAVGMMSYHLYYLCKTYFAWPTKNKLSLGFSSLPFPAVTVCNVNPVRASKLHLLSPDLQHLVETIDPDNIGAVLDNLPNATTTSNTTTQRRKRRETDDSLYDDVDDYEDDNDDDLILDNIDFGIFSNYSNDRVDIEDDFDEDEIEGYGGSWESEASPSQYSKIEEKVLNMYSAEPRASRIQAGHRLKEMLLSCSFAGMSCYARNFSLLTSTQFGNCFTLQYEKFLSRSSGPNGGLELLMFLDTDEYLRGVTADDGLQVTIHNQKIVPFPSDEGMAVSAGSNTKLSLRLIQIERMGSPYGDCHDSMSYMNEYGVKYSRQLCYKFCEQSALHKQCQCRDETQEDLNRLMKVNNLKPCRNRTEMRCMLRVHWSYQKGDIQCDCFNPCREAKYEKTISSRPWPNKEYAEGILLKTVCQRVTPEKCQKLKNKNARDLAQEFVKLNVYYEDLNYENITEEADYEDVQFISDIGGTLGLWIGLSVLSIMEVVQLVLELFKYLCCCRWARNKN